VGSRDCDWSFLSHEVTYFKGLGITKEDLVDDGVPVISYGQIHAKSNDGVHLRRDLLRYIPRELTEGNETCRLRRGDIVFADTSEDVAGVGNCILVDTDDEVYAGYHTLVARPKKQNSGAYLARLFQSVAWRSQIQSRICGIKVFSITRKILKGVSILTPSEEAQNKVVAYLDEKTAAIDARVAVLEKKIAAYKRLKASVINRAVTRGLNPKANLKDSGVDWIGKIPVGWDAVRVESHYDVQLGKMLSAKPSDASEIVLEYICAANVHYDGVSLNGLKQMWYLPREIETFRVKSGDLLVVEGGAGAGGCSVAENVDRIVCMQNSILRIRPTSTGSNRFLNYWFNDLGQRGYIGCACNVATIPHFTKEKMRQTPMPYPPSAEQIAIADYLDAECAKIDKMAELVTREIELYRKLKRSLVNEVMTGKREVA
jgi:type I restriction enzyme S subunit